MKDLDRAREWLPRGNLVLGSKLERAIGVTRPGLETPLNFRLKVGCWTVVNDWP